MFEGIYGAQSSSYQKHEASIPKSRDHVNRASPYPSCKTNRTKSHPETGGKPDIETDGPVTREDSPKNGESWTLDEDDTSLAETKADQELEEGGSTQGGGAERKSPMAQPTKLPSGKYCHVSILMSAHSRLEIYRHQILLILRCRMKMVLVLPSVSKYKNYNRINYIYILKYY